MASTLHSSLTRPLLWVVINFYPAGSADLRQHL